MGYLWSMRFSGLRVKLGASSFRRAHFGFLWRVVMVARVIVLNRSPSSTLEVSASLITRVTTSGTGASVTLSNGVSTTVTDNVASIISQANADNFNLVGLTNAGGAVAVGVGHILEVNANGSGATVILTAGANLNVNEDVAGVLAAANA